jgi:hypothetical protein
MHPAFIDGYRAGPFTRPHGFEVPARYFVPGTMFHYAAGLRARTVAHAAGVSLDPEVWALPSSRSSPDSVPGALDWWFR